jgi:hypothetical protein
VIQDARSHEIKMVQKLIQNALVAQRWFMPAFFIGVSLNKQIPFPPRRMSTRMATKTNFSSHVQGQM